MSGVVAVIDYGMGNLHSVASALAHAGADEVLVTHDARTDWRQPTGWCFPGVGAIRDCMSRDPPPASATELLARCADRTAQTGAGDLCGHAGPDVAHSMKRTAACPAWGSFPVKCAYFGKPAAWHATGERLKVPHMGWNEVRQTCANIRCGRAFPI